MEKPLRHRRAGRPRGHPPVYARADPRRGRAEHQRRHRKALPPDLEPLYGQPDGRLHSGHRLRVHHGRGLPVPGFRVSFDGFTALYEESTDDAKKKETALPPLEEGQTLKLKKLTADQKFTQPPPLYTEATLIHALEENGIGRPSTYAPIITTIVDRGYVEKDQKKLKTTPLGQAVNTVMMEQFPDIVNVKFSADMEKKLDVVEAGQADWVKTIDDFYQGFEKSLEQAEKNMEGKRIKVEDIPTDEICEKCGRPMVIKSGRYGKFVACSGFPECRNAHPLVKDTGGLCPLDGGHMLVRKSAKGRVYYGCSNYPKCNYMTWDEPVPEKCPQCGSTLFKKKGQLYCAKEGCGFVKAIEKK